MKYLVLRLPVLSCTLLISVRLTHFVTVTTTMLLPIAKLAIAHMTAFADTRPQTIDGLTCDCEQMSRKHIPNPSPYATSLYILLLAAPRSIHNLSFLPENAAR
jgi:hypothetical protein